MKKKHILLLTLLLLMLFSLPVMAASTKIVKKGQKQLTLNVGNQFVLKFRTVKTVKWTARNTSVYQISKKGLIKAKKAGTAKLAYKFGIKRYTMKLIVNDPRATSASSESSGSGGGGGGIVYWVPNGDVYHSTSSCRSLSRSRTIYSGPLSSCPKSRPCKNCH